MTWISASDELKPDAGKLVWIYDAKHHGVIPGRWAGWWETITRDDNLQVTHWRPMITPPPPTKKPARPKTTDRPIDLMAALQESLGIAPEPHMIGYQ